jgi:hypothetical protein
MTLRSCEEPTFSFERRAPVGAALLGRSGYDTKGVSEWRIDALVASQRRSTELT